MNGTKLFSVFFLLVLMTGMVSAVPGEAILSKTLNIAGPLAVATGGLQPMITENGKITWSIDAVGHTGTGYVSVAKPENATVRSAYLMAASTGYTGYTLSNSDITLAGNAITFTTTVPSSINSYNYWADVTSIVKPIADAQPAGTFALEITEAVAYKADGEVLVVIFDDPNQVNDNTIILAFGAQKTTGDTFNIGLADAINKSKDGFVLDMSLGISYSYQSGSAQYSRVDINGQRLTTSAGGEDDGYSANGGLITAGGIGDSNANPADPNATASTNPRVDDELYDLVPFVNDGDNLISAYTLNPSNDDNIFFAGFFLGATTGGFDIVLGPQSAVNYLNEDHTLTATVFEGSTPAEDVEVHFEIIDGPNAGMEEYVLTDSNGQAQWTYTSTSTGTDTIVASFMNELEDTIYSNEVTKDWKKKSTPDRCVSDLTLITGTVYDSNGSTVADKEVKVTCVEAVEYVTTDSEGNYQLVLPMSQCQTGDTVVVEADGLSNSGVVENDCKCVVNIAIVDLTIPEFGVIAGAVALIGALGIFMYRRN